MSAVAESAELESKALSLPDQAKAIHIVDQKSLEIAGEKLLAFAALRKEIIEHHKPIKQAADHAHRTACAQEAKVLAPVTEAEAILKGSIAEYLRWQSRLLMEAKIRAEETARKAAEEEALNAAIEAQAHGATEEEATAILEAPPILPAIRVAPTVQKVAGVSMAETWKAEVVDIKALCRAVADGKASPNFVEANMTSLNQMARAMKTTFNVPGCRAVPVSSIRAGAR